MRSRVKSRKFFIYLFIFISCGGSKLKANGREADFHLHTHFSRQIVSRDLSQTPRWPKFKAGAVQREI